MKLHPYIAAFLLACWWVLRERWDSVTFSAVPSAPWYVWLILAWIGFQSWPTIRARGQDAWRWIAPRVPGSNLLYVACFGVVAGLVLGFSIGWNVWPVVPPKPDVVVPPSPVAPDKVSRVTYVYEKDNGGVPSGVLVALNKLNRDGVLATAFEEDTTDASGQTPEQYKLAKEAANGNLPALVVERGNVAKVTPKVTTEAQVMEATR